MLNSEQYRVKVAEDKERGKKTDAPNEIREFKNLGRTFTEMADIFGRSDNAVIRLRVLKSIPSARFQHESLSWQTSCC